jgi:hypothetical protein
MFLHRGIPQLAIVQEKIFKYDNAHPFPDFNFLDYCMVHNMSTLLMDGIEREGICDS